VITAPQVRPVWCTEREIFFIDRDILLVAKPFNQEMFPNTLGNLSSYMSSLPVPLFLKVWVRADSERGGHEKERKKMLIRVKRYVKDAYLQYTTICRKSHTTTVQWIQQLHNVNAVVFCLM
jgi:hypothetical protein